MKNLIKKLSVFLLAIIAMLSLVACGEKETPSSESNSSSDNSTVSSSVEASVEKNSSTPTSSTAAFTPSTLVPYVHNFTQPETNYEEATTETTVFLVGDSTVCNYTETKEKAAYYYMRNGYGMRLGEYLNDKVTINNLALSGRSSKSFLKEANYTTLKNSIKAGDFLIIGFGHNDEKTEEARYTNPNGAVTEPTSLKYHLYEYYIKIALDAGATPILCTPIVRRVSSGTYSGNSIHQTAGNATYPGGDYTKAIIDLGAEKNVQVIDLTTITKNMLTGLSSDQSASIYAWKKEANITSVDNTHINAYGAQIVARLLCEELIKTECPLKNYVKKEFAVPSSSVLVGVGFDS